MSDPSVRESIESSELSVDSVDSLERLGRELLNPLVDELGHESKCESCESANPPVCVAGIWYCGVCGYPVSHLPRER